MDGSSRIVSRDMKLQRTVANVLEMYVKRIFLLLFNNYFIAKSSFFGNIILKRKYRRR